MRLDRCLGFALSLGLLGCSSYLPPGVEPLPPLIGQIEPLASRLVAASTSEVANGATVALIDPTSGNTIATTLSTPNGQFVLNFPPATFTPGSNPYFLEASKGLGTSSNQVGASAVRLRTLIRMNNGDWESFSSNGIYVGRSTTALAILSSLKGLSVAQNIALLKTLAVGATSTVGGITSPDTFGGTPAVLALEYQQVWDLVTRSLEQNADPMASIVQRPNATASVVTDLGSGYGLRPGFGWAAAGIVLADVSPAAAAVGSTLTLYGHGLNAGLTVRLNSLSCPVLTTDGTTATFRLPAGSTSGNLEVRSGPWIHRGLFVTVL